MEKMHMLKDTLERELDKIAGKGTISAGDLETVFKLITSIKGIYKIKMYEEEEGYSEDGGMWRAEGGYSSRRGRRRSSRDSYAGGDSYANGQRGGYPSEGGYSGRRGRGSSRDGYSMHDAKHEVMEEIQELMEMEGITGQDREILRKAMMELGR